MINFHRAFITALLILPITLLAKEYVPFSKTLNREAVISSSSRISVQSNFGDVTIKTWSESKIKVEALVVGNIEKKADLEAFYEDLEDGVLAQNGEDVRVKSPISKYIFGDFAFSEGKRRWVETCAGNKFGMEALKIHFTIHLPAQNDLAVNSRYGDMVVDSYKGRLSVNHYNGNVSVSNLSGETAISSKYADLIIKNAGNLKLSAYDGSVKLDGVKDIKLSSKYATIDIGDVRTASIASYNDKMKIGTSSEVTISSKYSEIELGLSQMVTANLYEGELSCPKADRISLNAKYADIKLGEVEDITMGGAYNCNISIEKVSTFQSGGSKYSNYRIQDLLGNCSANSYEDKIEIRHIGLDAKNVMFQGKYSEYYLSFNKDHKHILTVNRQYGELDAPSGYYTIKSKNTTSTSSMLTAETASGRGSNNVSLSGYSSEFQITTR